jgi:NDP-sugar pyrophosphorylase family protein
MVISNLPIEGALAQHRARRALDKNAIMTMVLREAGLRSPVMTCLASRSRITSPTDVEVDFRKVSCLNGEDGALHFDALIEYTLEFLANAGVEEVFLYAGAHSDQLEKYIK